MGYYLDTGDLASTAEMFGHKSASTNMTYVKEVAKYKAAISREKYQFED